jgi:integration host factor subunit beta
MTPENHPSHPNLPQKPSSSSPRPDPKPAAGTSSPAPGPGASSAPRTITKKELVARIAERTGQTKVVARDVIQMFLDEIIAELGSGNRLEFREFGVFEIKERAARKAQNPRTLEKVDVPAKRVVKFRVGRLMKERVGDIPEGSEHIADGSDAYDDDEDDEE